MFFCEICEIFMDIFLYRTSPVVNSALFLKSTCGRVLLIIAIICREYSKLNARRIRMMTFWSLTSAFLMASPYTRLNYNTSLEQSIRQHGRIKPSHLSAYQTTKWSFIWPRGASENIFQVKSLARLSLGGNVRISRSQSIC